MANILENTLGELSAIQRRAVEWENGSMLVLAGPGSGKTRVLTCRVARLLDQSRDERFRVLALTFTNKAAHEMSSRVATLTPGLEERAAIHTFHGFCAQVLRQHGVHLWDQARLCDLLAKYRLPSHIGRCSCTRPLEHVQRRPPSSAQYQCPQGPISGAR